MEDNRCLVSVHCFQMQLNAILLKFNGFNENDGYFYQENRLGVLLPYCLNILNAGYIAQQTKSVDSFIKY